MTIGELIKKYREERELSQEELAKLLGYKSRSTIQKIESGEREVPRKMIARLSIVLNVSPLELLKENEKSLSPKDKRKALAEMLTDMSDEEIDELYEKHK